MLNFTIYLNSLNILLSLVALVIVAPSLKQILQILRSSHANIFYKKVGLNNFTRLTEKDTRWSTI